MHSSAIALALPSLLRLFAMKLGGASAAVAVAAETACRGGFCLNAAGEEESTLMQLKSKPAQDSSVKASGDFNYRSFQIGDWPSVPPPEGSVNMCDASRSGGFQAPINIEVAGASYETSAIPGPKFYARDGGCSEGMFVNKSTAWQVDLYDPKQGVGCNNLEMEWNGKVYVMIQFHWHTLSEDTFDFHPYPMQMHMVHLAEDNSLAVVGVLHDTGGLWFKQNSFLNGVFATGFDSMRMVSSPAGQPINPYKSLLQRHGEFWHYPGSLTTPPCSAPVDFLIAKDPVNIAAVYVTNYEKYLKERGGNSYGQNHRPIQPLNGRDVTVGRWAEVCPLNGKVPNAGHLDPDFCHFVEEYA